MFAIQQYFLQIGINGKTALSLALQKFKAIQERANVNNK